MLRSRITSLSCDGTGRIASEAGDEFPFDRSQLLHADFDRLAVEQSLRLLEGTTRAGREARHI